MVADVDIAQLESMCQETADVLGLWLYDVELSSQRGEGVLRVYVDRHEGGAPGTGVTIEECSAMSAALGLRLEQSEESGEGVWSGYSLEVSSPGVERELRRASHYRWAQGRQIGLELTSPVEGVGASLRGVLDSSEAEALRVRVEPAGKNWKKGQKRSLPPVERWEVVELPLSQVRRAYIVYEDL